MTTTQIPSTASITPTSAPGAPRPNVWRYGVAASMVAAVATTTLAAIASAAGVSFSNGTGAGIPILGFTELTLVFSLVGVGLAAVMARRVRRPRSTFRRTTIALLVLSYVPDLTVGFDAPSAAALVGLHTVAALVVIPTLVRRLAPTR